MKKAEEKARADAKSRIKLYDREHKKALEPEQMRIWAMGPFAAVASRPTEIDLFNPLPEYGARLGVLTFAYLEAVSRLYYQIVYSYMFQEPWPSGRNRKGWVKCICKLP